MQELSKFSSYQIADDLTLDQYAVLINQVNEAYIFIVGEILLRAKALCEHGEFIPWVKKNCPFAIRQANHYMQVTARKDEFVEAPTSLKGAIRELKHKDQIGTAVPISKSMPETPLERANAHLEIPAKIQELYLYLEHVAYGRVEELHPTTKANIKEKSAKLRTMLDNLDRRLSDQLQLRIINNEG